MESRRVIIALIVILFIATIVVGIWWFTGNEDQLGTSTTPAGLVSVLSAWEAIR